MTVMIGCIIIIIIIIIICTSIGSKDATWVIAFHDGVVIAVCGAVGNNHVVVGMLLDEYTRWMWIVCVDRQLPLHL